MRDKLGWIVLTAGSLLLLGCSHAPHASAHIIAPSYSYLASPDNTAIESDGRILATAPDPDLTPQP